MGTIIGWLIVGALAGGLPLATAGILDLDFTSDGSGDAGAFGGGAPYGTAPGYTPFVVAELGPSAGTSLNPSITVGAVNDSTAVSAPSAPTRRPPGGCRRA